MVWGILFPDGYVHLEPILGTLTGQKYVKLLSDIVPKLDREFGVKKYYLQQDNASVHTAKVVKNYIASGGEGKKISNSFGLLILPHKHGKIILPSRRAVVSGTSTFWSGLVACASVITKRERESRTAPSGLVWLVSR